MTEQRISTRVCRHINNRPSVRGIYIIGTVVVVIIYFRLGEDDATTTFDNEIAPKDVHHQEKINQRRAEGTIKQRDTAASVYIYINIICIRI